MTHSRLPGRVLRFSEGIIRKSMPQGTRAEDRCLFDAVKSAIRGLERRRFAIRRLFNESERPPLILISWIVTAKPENRPALASVRCYCSLVIKRPKESGGGVSHSEFATAHETELREQSRRSACKIPNPLRKRQIECVQSEVPIHRRRAPRTGVRGRLP